VADQNRVLLVDAAGNPLVYSTPADSKSPGSFNAETLAFPHSYNGSSWDRLRNNEEFIILASAERTATTVSASLTNHNHFGVVIWFDVTAHSGALIMTPQLRYPNLAGAADDLIQAFSTVNSVERQIYTIAPHNRTDPVGIDGAVESILPRTWTFRVAHDTADAVTYAVHGCYVG